MGSPPSKRNYKKDCAACGCTFKAKRKDARFCCGNCRSKASKVSTDDQYSQISGNFSRYLARLLHAGGKKRENLTVPMLLEILDEQGGRCALTGVELTCILQRGVSCKTNVSIDRIEAGGPYIKENIQLVCTAVNKFRVDTELDEFIWWCKKVAEYNG